MLAGTRVDRKHEQEPSWAARPFGRGGRCDCELHADSDGRIYACRLHGRCVERLSPRPMNMNCHTTTSCSSYLLQSVFLRVSVPGGGSPLRAGNLAYSTAMHGS